LLRVGVIAPKNDVAHLVWPMNLIQGVSATPYIRGGRYDLVFFLNVTSEIAWIKRHTDMKCFVAACEPPGYAPNYNPDLLDLADHYMGLSNFSRRDDTGFFQRFVFPVATEERIRDVFPSSCRSTRDLDFCLFARHDPNFRVAASELIARHRSFLGGPLFSNPIPMSEILSIRQRCRYEIITENDINDFYFSEKVWNSLLAGCVPVYFGCRQLKQTIPAEFFIDMHDYCDSNGSPNLHAIVSHCMTPGVYERYFAEVNSRAMPVLLQYSLEKSIVQPIQQVVDRLASSDFRASRQSVAWTYWQIRNQLKSALHRLRLLKPNAGSAYSGGKVEW
jgi:hypothetical protein